MKKKEKLLSFHEHERYMRKANDLCYPAKVVSALNTCRTESDAESIMRKARVEQIEKNRKANTMRYLNNHKYATAMIQQFA